MVKFPNKNIIARLINFSIIIFSITYFSQISQASSSKKLSADDYPGYMVKYHYIGFEEEREIAYQYYLDHESQYMPGIKKDQLGIDLYDIDDDGIKEIILYINGRDKCPNAGCPFTTLKPLYNDIKKYKIINWSVSTGISTGSNSIGPKITDNCTNGYHNILFFRKPNNKLIPATLSKWNGKYYD